MRKGKNSSKESLLSEEKGGSEEVMKNIYLLKYILEFVSDRVELSSVSKLWYNIIRSLDLYLTCSIENMLYLKNKGQNIHYFSPTPPHPPPSFLEGGVGVPYILDGIHTVNIVNYMNMTLKFKNIHTLYLQNCVNTSTTNDIIDAGSHGTPFHTLNLGNCTKLTNVDDLSGIHTICLSNCVSLTNDNMKPLGNSYSLSLICSENIVDVSIFTKVHTLQLICCKNVRDVSPLKNIHTLKLIYCNDVTDVSSLGAVNTLTMNNCSGVVDVSKLGGVHTLDLSNCINIVDASALGKVNNLNLAGCTGIKHLPILSQSVLTYLHPLSCYLASGKW